MEELLAKLLDLAPNNLTQSMPTEVEFSVKSLMISSESTARRVPPADSSDVANALFKIQAVLDVTWEQLNTGHWSEVPLHLRHVYTAASFVKVLLLLKQPLPANHQDSLTAALKAADMGLLLGAPLPSNSGGCLTKAAATISSTLTGLDQSGDTEEFSDDGRESDEEELRDRIRGKPIARLQRPSLEKFRTDHFEPQTPVVLTDCMGHWPAMERWRRPRYLRQVAGARTVPVELGARYTDDEWRQRLMRLDEFIDKHVLGRDPEVGYLAQHPLLQQVPELRADIREPDYCCVSARDDVADGDTDVNAWFGPKGTVSPLHFDPKNNLLAQVVGRKRVYLFAPCDAPLLYPHASRMLANTARADPERPDFARLPRFRAAAAWECELAPGEMLYIPPAWWHHVRALSASFSVSFWWR